MIPNIVFILADDLGWGHLGADGSEFHESPNIDRCGRCRIVPSMLE